MANFARGSAGGSHAWTVPIILRCQPSSASSALAEVMADSVQVTGHGHASGGSTIWAVAGARTARVAGTATSSAVTSPASQRLIRRNCRKAGGWLSGTPW